MRGLLLFFISIICLTFNFKYVTADNVVKLFGNSKEWANKELQFYKYSDYITYDEILIGKTKIDNNGDFTLYINVNDTTYIFTYLGKYAGYMYVVPGRSYQIVLPPYQEKTEADKLNPYFEPIFIHLGIIDVEENDINILIHMFNDTYSSYFSKYVVESINKTNINPKEIEKDIEKIEVPFINYKDEFFKNYRIYKYALLEHLSFKEKSVAIAEKYFKNKKILLTNPSYMDLFNQIFTNFFEFHGRTKEGIKIYEDINVHKDYNCLVNTLSKNSLFNNNYELMELVILKCLFEEFYKDKFSRSGILNILDTIINETKYEQNKIIACRIKNKITKLLPGYNPPDFNLYDINGNLKNLQNYRGKYVYLNFCNTASYSCLMEFDLLNDIQNRHKNNLIIVTISTDSLVNSFKQFVETKGYNWEFLHYGNYPEILKEYDIRSFPTYFLIDPQGKLVMSPAPSPSEYFEYKFINLVREKGN